MEQLTDSTIHIKKVKEHLRQFSFDAHPVERVRLKERTPELAELVLIYDMLHSLQTSVAKDLKTLELHLIRIENQRLNSASEKGMQQHCQAGAESLADEKLSRREQEVLLQFAKGYSYNEVAEIFSCKIATIQTYAKRIYKKLNVHSRSEAIFEAAHLGIINL